MAGVLKSVHSAGISDLLPSGRMRTNCRPVGMRACRKTSRDCLEGVLGTRDDHAFGEVLMMGSVSCVPLTTFHTANFYSVSPSESSIGTCCV